MRRLVRMIFEEKRDEDLVFDLLKRLEDHVYRPMTRDELKKFASSAMSYPRIFSYGPDVPRVDVYRGYRELDESGIKNLLGHIPDTFSGVYQFRPSVRDMSWTPIFDVALTVAEPSPSMWSAVAKTNTSTGQWLSPGPDFENFVVRSGRSSSESKLLSSEYLQVSPGRRHGSIAVVKFEKDRDYEDVYRELDELSSKL